MSQQGTSHRAAPESSQGDPWHAFGYVVSGVVVYGVLGGLADRWMGTDFLVAIGILVGAGLGIYMTFARFNRQTTPPTPSVTPSRTPHDDRGLIEEDW